MINGETVIAVIVRGKGGEGEQRMRRESVAANDKRYSISP